MTSPGVVVDQYSVRSALKVLIAGFGSAGRRHFRNLTTLGVTDVGFYRSSNGTLPADEIEGRPVFRDLQEAISWGPTVAIVANPTALHLPVALTAVRAGVDVLIEKPLSNTLDGCNELQQLADDRGLVTMVGCQYHFHPLLVRWRERLHRGEFGETLFASAVYAENLRLWHPWEDHRRGYSARPELGGGAILTLIHPLDYLRWLFGPVRDVHASARKASFLETAVDDDVADLTLEFDNGVTGHVHLDFVQDPPVHTLEIVCERGRGRLDFLAGTLDWQPSGGSGATVEHVPPGYERNTMFVDELSHFLRCVTDRTSSNVPLADGIAVLEIALRARQDAERRRR